MPEEENWKLDSEMLQKLDRKKIYFAHMSVGYNILDGIAGITEKLSIVELDELNKLDDTVFLHSKIGKNFEPLLKLEDFKNKMILENVGNSVDIAMLKFCYVDINETTNIDSLFNSYTETFHILTEKYPDLTFVHLTNPLMSQRKGIKSFIKRILGKPVYGYEDNVKRQKFNEMIRVSFPVVFDIAEIESTKPDGTRMIHDLKGETYYSMYPGYTDDGGHLNENGRQLVAYKLLKFLSEL